MELRMAGNFLDKKKILITGCCGTVGKELVRQITEGRFGSAEVLGIDNAESGIFSLSLEYPLHRFRVVDITNGGLVDSIMAGVDYCIHTAALKHVVTCEFVPEQAIDTNIHGVQNVISAAIKHNLKKVIFTSSDKAVNPTNVMGTTKLMGEKLISSTLDQSSTIFASTRFGNVLGSNGSVVPIFAEQIAQGLAITITAAEMSRFIMNVEKAVELVMQSLVAANGGEIFVTKMPSVRISDLAQAMYNTFRGLKGLNAERIKIEYIGPKPGEKMFEELMNSEETRRSIETNQFFVILPPLQPINKYISSSEYLGVVSDTVCQPYRSDQESYLSIGEIQDFLQTLSPLW